MTTEKERALKQKIEAREITARSALRYGDTRTRLSLFIGGLGNLTRGQIARGLFYLLAEAAYVLFMILRGVGMVRDFITLGTSTQIEVYNDATGVYEYLPGDNSMLCLLFGVVVLFVTLLFIAIMLSSLRSAYSAQRAQQAGRRPATVAADLRSLIDQNLHKGLLALPITGVVIFTVIPLVFMILIAFTSYDSTHQPPGNLFGWVGLDNFKAMFASGGKLSQTFWPVLIWTIVWAVFATFTNYILGMMLAVVINRKETRWKSFWRFMFVLSIAVPSFVTLLTMKTILGTNGALNVILRDLHMIGQNDSVPWLSDPLLAKVMIIVVNIWIGIPYTMLTTTGILQNIPPELYEAAKVDGATPVKMFFKITLPYMMFIMTPYLITTFVGNINNFNVIYLLSGGGPETLNYYYAGQTDLLVTWLYKLTITNKDYNLGAVIGIITFILLAVCSGVAYRRSKSYKNEEAFQ